MNNESLFKNYFYSNNNGEIILDNDYNIITFNKKAYELLSQINIYIKENSKFLELFEYSYKNDLLSSLEETKKNGKLKVFKKFNYNGNEFWYQFNYFPIFNEKEEIIGVGLNILDVTKEKENESFIRKYEFIVDSTNEAMTLINRNYVYEAVNKYFCKAHNKSLHEIIGKTVADFWGEETFDNIIKPRIDDCFKGNIGNYSEWFEFKGFGLSYMNTTYYPYYNENNEITHVVVLSRNVTEIKKYADELQKLNEELKKREEFLKRYESIVNASQEFMTLINKNYQYEAVNEYFCRAHNKPREYIIGKTVADIWGKETFEKIIKDRLDDGFSGNIGKYDDWFVFGILGRRYISSSYYPYYDENGEVNHVIVISHDTTRLKEYAEKMEELNQTLEQKVQDAINEIRQKEQLLLLKSRQAAMGEMIDNIAHQWKQPLSSINLLLQNILFHSEENLSKEILETKISKILEMINFMCKTINDFRYFFYPASEKVEFSLNEVIVKTISFVEDTFKSNNIMIIKDMESEVKYFGFPNELSQVILNILHNAKDAILNKKIQESKVIVKVFKEILNEKNKIKIIITDNGGGIPEDVLPKIFDPYFSTKKQGSGIGLYIAKTIIEKHFNGKIYALNVELENNQKGAQIIIEI